MPTEKEYMLEEATAAATYQPKLTAGRNINISEDNVISSPDPPPSGSTVTVTPNQMSGNLIATVTVDSNSYNLYSPIPPVMTGATSGASGAQGLVPAPSIGYQDYILYGDGTWKDPEIPNIIANPAVSATTDLTKIYIDGTVYGVSGGGGSSNFEAVEISKTSYDLLPTSEKTDQDKIYMVYGEDNAENVNFKQGTLHNQYSMSTNLRKTQASFIWDGGSAIGSEIRFNTPIDITNIDKISYGLTTTTCYGHNNANVEEQENQRFHIRVLLFDTMIPASDWEADHLNDQSLLTYNSHIYTNTTYTNEECIIDTSNLTGNVYLIVSAAGWNCTFTNLQLHMNSIVEKKQINWNNKTWGTNFDSVKISYKDYINLPLAKKEDVSKIYMVSQPKLNYLNMLEVTKIETTDAPIYPISKNEIDFTYSSGNGPGQWLYFNDVIDVTNIDKIYYSMVTGDNYDTLNSQDNNQRYLAVGLKSTTTSSWAAPYNMGYTLYNEYDNEYTNSTLNDEYLDVSQLTGEYYLTISGVGWNIVFTDIGTLSSSPEYENMIYWNNKCFSNASNGLKYWQETPQRFYRDYYVDGLSADEGYKLTEMMCAQWTSYDTANGYLYRKKNNEPAVMACLTNNYSYGDNRRYVFVSKTTTAIDWEWATCRPSTDPFIPTSDWGAKETYPLVPTQYPTYPFGWQTTIIEYGGDIWYVMGIQPPYSDSTLQYRSNEMLTLYMGNVSSATITELGQFVLENLHVTGRIDAQISIGANDNIFQWTIDGENIAWINKDGTSSFDKEEVVSLTQSEYDALPSSKLTDNIVYFIHPEQILDPNYNYVYADNGKIIVRIYHEGESDEEIYWFFNNYSHSSGVYAIPSNLTDYYNTSTAQAATAYDPTTGNHVAGIVVNQYGNMGVYVPGWGSYYTSPVNCKLSMNYPDNTVQNTTYEDPYIYIDNNAYKIIFNGYEYINTDIVTHEGLTPEEYELLPIDQKTNGEIYFISDNGTVIELVARMTSASSASEGTVSGYDTYTDREPWMAFRTDSSMDVSYVGEFWYGASTDAYIQFDFNNRVNITEIDFASNVAVTANILYSKDGVNYISGANLAYQNTSSCYKENFSLSEELTNCISIRIKPVTQAAIGCVHFIGYPASNNKIYYMGKNYTSGGGDGSNSIKTTLLDVNTATSPMNLSDSIFNYDMIFLEIKDGNGYTRGVSFVPSILEIGQVIGFDNTYGYTWNTITSGTVLTNTSRNNFYIASIVGIKL